jgi:Ca-activated chloride channel family protein
MAKKIVTECSLSQATGLAASVNLRGGLRSASSRNNVLPVMASLVALIALSHLAWSQAPASQQSSNGSYTLRLNSNLVLLNATVVDGHNALVSDLNRGDFKIYEDKVPQEIKNFSHEDVPVTVGIVIDNSGSMAPKRNDVIDAALSFTGSSNPKDQMFVVNFNDHVSFGLPAKMPFTDRRDQLELALSSFNAIGETALYDGIATALNHLQQGSYDKKVLILISDGGDNVSKHNLAQVIELAKSSNAIIYAIGIFDERDGDQNPGVLKRFAKATGGKAFFPESPKEIAPICEGIARDIRNQYTLAYVPAGNAEDGRYRAIEVRASAPGHGHLSVRTRAGYSPPSAPAVGNAKKLP